MSAQLQCMPTTQSVATSQCPAVDACPFDVSEVIKHDLEATNIALCGSLDQEYHLRLQEEEEVRKLQEAVARMSAAQQSSVSNDQFAQPAQFQQQQQQFGMYGQPAPFQQQQQPGMHGQQLVPAQQQQMVSASECGRDVACYQPMAQARPAFVASMNAYEQRRSKAKSVPISQFPATKEKLGVISPLQMHIAQVQAEHPDKVLMLSSDDAAAISAAAARGGGAAAAITAAAQANGGAADRAIAAIEEGPEDISDPAQAISEPPKSNAPPCRAPNPSKSGAESGVPAITSE